MSADDHHGFEGSYMGANDRISDQARMECKICWTPYDPAEGDDFRQIPPGTPFVALPDDWKCPTCDAPKAQFMVLDDPGAEAMLEEAAIGARTQALVADFREVYHAKMRDVPVCNKALQVEAVGFRRHGDALLGVLIAPWFMNLVLLPGAPGAWDDLTPGGKEVVTFPSGAYEFLHNAREQTGGYKACSLFSPMGEFTRHQDAVDVAKAVMVALFDEANRADTDRAADIRAAREADLAPPEPEAPAEPSRRAVISAGMATDKEADDV